MVTRPVKKPEFHLTSISKSGQEPIIFLVTMLPSAPYPRIYLSRGLAVSNILKIIIGQ